MNVMPLFTVLFEFKGGTYVSQIRAASLRTALYKWADRLEVSEIWGLGSSGKESLRVIVRDRVPVALRGLSKVWCQSMLIRGKLGLINIVQSDSSR